MLRRELLTTQSDPECCPWEDFNLAFLSFSPSEYYFLFRSRLLSRFIPNASIWITRSFPFPANPSPPLTLSSRCHRRQSIARE